MNKKVKRRLAAVSAIIVIVVIFVLAFVCSQTASKTISVAEAVSGAYTDTNQNVSVSGVVMNNSSVLTEDGIDFSIYDADNASVGALRVRYSGAVSSTFGNGVTAVCTGKISSEGVLVASTMLIKCPSKYDGATEALGVADMDGFGDSLKDVALRVQGRVKENTLAPAGSDERFVLEETFDTSAQTEQNAQRASIGIVCYGTLPEGIQAGINVVVTGSLGTDDKFHATNVSLAE